MVTTKPAQWLALHFRSLEDPGCLERLAGWCYQYSSQVCIAARHDSLLLETAASRLLFGHTETLARKICNELEQLGYHATHGIAPTAEAALIATRHGLHIRAIADIRKDVGALDITSLHLGAADIAALHKMGFRRASEVFRLPRKALARRLSPAVNDYLERLLGQRPDPRKTFRPPDDFSAGMDLADTQHTQGLAFPLQRLVQELCGVLRARDRGIQALQVQLHLANKGLESIHLDLRQVTRDKSHLMLLLRERLERLKLPCPVRHISLQAADFLPCSAYQADLLQDDGVSPRQDSSTIERLQARLGTGSVYGVTGRQDHRPEYSWAVREPDTASACTPQPGRPAWLLPDPQPCRIENYQVLTGPERIETGWWDGRDCRRDYFVVQDPDGSTLWAFREYKPNPGWYLQGLFS